MSAAPRHNTIDSKMKDLGCPYRPDDPRAVPWLNGYQVGYQQASEMAIKKMESLVGRPLR